MDETHESWLTATQMNTCGFATAAPLGLAKGGTLNDAQGHTIEAHGTRTGGSDLTVRVLVQSSESQT